MAATVISFGMRTFGAGNCYKVLEEVGKIASSNSLVKSPRTWTPILKDAQGEARMWGNMTKTAAVGLGFFTLFFGGTVLMGIGLASLVTSIVIDDIGLIGKKIESLYGKADPTFSAAFQEAYETHEKIKLLIEDTCLLKKFPSWTQGALNSLGLISERE